MNDVFARVGHRRPTAGVTTSLGDEFWSNPLLRLIATVRAASQEAASAAEGAEACGRHTARRGSSVDVPAMPDPHHDDL